MTKLFALDSIVLGKGAHDNAAEAWCVLEAASLYDPEANAVKMNGHTKTDHPADVCPVIGEFLRAWNDAMNDTERQMLVPYIPKLRGTKSTAKVEMVRSYLALDWLCRTSVPTWLRLIDKENEAKAVESCAPIVDAKSAKAAQKALDEARRVAAAAWAAAWAAAGDAAWAAAGDAAWAAVRPPVVTLQASAFDLLDRMLAA